MKTKILKSILSELQGIRKALEPKVKPCPSNEQCQSWIADQLDGEQLQDYQKPKWPESYEDITVKDQMRAMYSQKSRDIFDAFEKLYALLQAYRGDWRPDWKDVCQPKFIIMFWDGNVEVDRVFRHQTFLAFETETQAEHFLKHHRELIEQARELL